MTSSPCILSTSPQTCSPHTSSNDPPTHPQIFPTQDPQTCSSQTPLPYTCINSHTSVPPLWMATPSTPCISQLRPVHLSYTVHAYLKAHNNLHPSSTKHWPDRQLASIKCSSYKYTHDLRDDYMKETEVPLLEAGVHPDPAMHIALGLWSLQFA